MQENEDKSKYEFSLLVPSQCQQRFLEFCVCIVLYKEGFYMNEHQTQQINNRSEFSCLLKFARVVGGFWQTAAASSEISVSFDPQVRIIQSWLFYSR